MVASLDGLRVVDFTQGIAGPLATMLLADHGAAVTKVEPPGGDRLAGTRGYVCWARNKERVVLDLERYPGRAIALQLIAGAHAAVFDARPGELERLGLDSLTLLERYPGLLHTWMPPIATAGRWSQLPPDDALLSAVSGVSWLQLSYAEQPVWMLTPQASYGHGMVAACAIASGLFEQRRSGLGQALVVDGLSGIAAVQPTGMTVVPGAVRLSRTSRGGAPNYSLYPCADGQWLFLGCLVAHFFLKALDTLDLIEVLALPGIDGEFANIALHPEARVIIYGRIEARFAEKPRDEWLHILHAAGVPCAPAGDRELWFRGETVAANDMRLVLDDARLGKIELPGVNIKLADTPGAVRHLLRDRPADAPSPPALRQPEAPPPSPVAGGPLAGVRVLDLGAFIAGTYAPTFLAYFGADVIKIEPPEGEGFRSYGLMFIGSNQGKRGLCVDLKNPDGRALFYDLVREADVVLDNYRMGVRERLGVDYATLSAINPRIVTCSVTAYGPEGPLSPNPGFDPLVQAQSGMMLAQGGNVEPVFYQIAVNDTSTAMMAALGIVLALHARETTGRGQEVTTCLANQSILCQSGELTSWDGAPPASLGGLDYLGPSALRRLYRCLDNADWVVLACTSPAHFHGVVKALGHPEWAGRHIAERALAEPPDGPLAELIAGALAALPADEACDRLLADGVPAARALAPANLLSDPFLRANNHWWTFDHPQFGEVTGVSGYGTWSRTAARWPRRAPLLGEHSAEVLRDFGIDEARVASLLASGVVRGG